jgi:hypothetical protein
MLSNSTPADAVNVVELASSSNNSAPERFLLDKAPAVVQWPDTAASSQHNQC